MAWSASVLCVLCGRAWVPAPWRVGYGQMRVLCGTGEVCGAALALDDGACAGRLWRGRGRTCGCPRG